MPPSLRRRRTAGLRTRLLLPFILVALAATLGLGVVGDASSRSLATTLVRQRGETVLSGVGDRLRERQQAKVVFAQLLAGNEQLALAVSQGDTVRLAQLLVAERSRLGLSNIDVYDNAGVRLLSLGPASQVGTELVGKALAGLNPSASGTTTSGLVVAAAAPVKGPQGIVGAVVVSRTLGGTALSEVSGREGLELAVFKGGELTANTTGIRLKSESHTRLLAGSRVKVDDRSFQPVVRPLAGDDKLVALVPVDDLLNASGLRRLHLALGISLLMGALGFVGLHLARRIAKPLEKLSSLAERIAGGDYSQRVEDSGIRELDRLGSSVNNLADEVRARVEDLVHDALHDALTTLPNRTLLADRAGHALRRRDDGLVSMLFVDLDDFKNVNDSLGHAVGDELLVSVAARLRSCARDGDTTARLGGDEFGILLDRVNNPDAAALVAQRVLRAMEPPFQLDGREVRVTASVGVSFNEPGSGDVDVLLRSADVAMYLAKERGKARFEIFESAMYDQIIERLELKGDLQRALDQEEFVLHYQPIVELAGGRVSGAEALVRWEHPTRGLVPPLTFIPLAEETGLIVPIGLWVLNHACHWARRWQEEHQDGEFTVSVNLSVRQLESPDLVDDVVSALRDSGLDPRHLTLEVTESVFLHDVEVMIPRLKAVRDLGVQLAIDDFGTGYSSLQYLQRFPVDIIKIDKSFVDAMSQTEAHPLLLTSILNMAKSLHVRSVAEGIETPEQLKGLTELACDFGQGYHFTRPLPQEAFEALFSRPSLASSSLPG